MANSTNVPESLLRLPQVLARTGLSKSSVYILPSFPKPVKIDGRAVAWVASEVDAWVAATILASRQDQAQSSAVQP
jgi:prophage regulatory protein